MKTCHLAILLAFAMPITTAISQSPSPTATPRPLSAKDQAFVDSGGQWITDDTIGARSAEDLSELQNMALSDDTSALIKMANQGRVLPLARGQRVHVQETSVWNGVAKVRPMGQTKSWWIDLSKISRSPVAKSN